MAKVTAIVSAYHAEKYLEGRIENLLGQTLKPEIVVVCHKGSKEFDIVKPFADRGELVVRWFEANLPIPTVYAAWNAGIQVSTGEYLTNANCDDRLHPDGLKRLTEALDQHPAHAVAYADAAVVEQIDGPVVSQFRWAEGGLRKLLEGCFLGPMPMWRRSLHEKYGMFNEELHSAGDYEFWLRIAARGERFWHVKEVLGTYLNRKDSVEHREPVRSAWETARARAKYRGDHGQPVLHTR